MAKFITRTYKDAKTGKNIKKNFRVNDDYEVRKGESFDKGRNQNYTEEIQDQPGLAKTTARAALPGIVGAGLGAIAKSPYGGESAGKAASALGGTALAAAGNAYANYQNRNNPNSKAAAVKAGAVSTAANAFADANQRNIARGAGVGGSALSGLGAGLEGAMKGGLSMLPGGASLGEGVSPLLGGIANAIKGGNPAALLQGLAGAAGGILRSKTLGKDLPQWFQKSEAKDYAGGTWGQGSGVEDLSNEEQHASKQAYLEENQPSVRSDMPADFEGTAKEWMSPKNDEQRQANLEQDQMDAHNAAYEATINKGGSESEAQDAARDAQGYYSKTLSLDDIDQQTGGEFLTPQQQAGQPAGEAGQQQQTQPQQQGGGATEVAPGTIEAENAATDERVRRMGGVYGTVDANGIPHPPAAGQGQPAAAGQAAAGAPPQQPQDVQAAQRLPIPPTKYSQIPAPPAPPPPSAPTASGQVRLPLTPPAPPAAAAPAVAPEPATSIEQRTQVATAGQAARAKREAAAAPAVEPQAEAAAAAAPALTGLTQGEQEGAYNWGRGKVAGFTPVEDYGQKDIELMPDYSGKSKEDIERENAALMAQEEDTLRNQSPAGSTNYYNEQPEKYEFLGGYGYKQREAEKLTPQTVFTVQGDANYEKPSENDSLMDDEGRVFIRTPLGMLQVGTKDGKEELPKAYRTAAERIGQFLSLNEMEPNEDYINAAEQLYNQLPEEVKGYSEKPTEERKKGAMRSAMMDLSGQTSERALKAKMTELTDNARKWKIRAAELERLRGVYKKRKEQLRQVSPTMRQRVESALGEGGTFGYTSPEEEAEYKNLRKANRNDRLMAARAAAERGETDLSKMSNREKLEYLKQQEFNEYHGKEAPYRNELTHQLEQLQGEAAGMPEMNPASPEGQRHAAEIRRLQSMINRTRNFDVGETRL
jgi:hypothetical protein